MQYDRQSLHLQKKMFGTQLTSIGRAFLQNQVKPKVKHQWWNHKKQEQKKYEFYRSNIHQTSTIVPCRDFTGFLSKLLSMIADNRKVFDKTDNSFRCRQKLR